MSVKMRVTTGGTQQRRGRWMNDDVRGRARWGHWMGSGTVWGVVSSAVEARHSRGMGYTQRTKTKTRARLTLTQQSGDEVWRLTWRCAKQGVQGG